MDGSILLHRQLIESYVFANATDLKIWIWLLLKAKYKAGFVEIKVGKGTRTIRLKRGQLLYGRHKAEEALKIPGTTIGRHLEKMKAEKMILIEVDSLYSIITICKYDSYQTTDNKSGQLTDSQRTGNGQVTDTYNKDNKDNKDNNITLSGEKYDLSKSNLYRQPKIPEMEEVSRVFAQHGGTEQMAQRFFETMESVGWFYKSSPVTDFSKLVPRFIEAWNKNLIERNGTTKTVSKRGAGVSAAINDLKEYLNAGAVQDV